MTNNARMILIALGVALIVVILVVLGLLAINALAGTH